MIGSSSESVCISTHTLFFSAICLIKSSSSSYSYSSKSNSFPKTPSNVSIKSLLEEEIVYPCCFKLFSISIGENLSG